MTYLYKIIAKVLSLCLKPALQSTIGDHQFGYVEGRQILDSSIVVNETVEDYRARKKKGLIFKIDFAMAQDQVDWAFLDFILDKKGFEIDRAHGLGLPIFHQLFHNDKRKTQGKISWFEEASSRRPGISFPVQFGG